jgi:hypothetical protein
MFGQMDQSKSTIWKQGLGQRDHTPEATTHGPSITVDDNDETPESLTAIGRGRKQHGSFDQASSHGRTTGFFR